MTSYQDNPLSGYPLLALSPDIPSDADALSARTQIKISEAEIHRLEFELSIILARRARMVARLDRCRTVIAPYKKLPIELVRKIMVLSVPAPDAESAIVAQTTREQCLLRVTQICATWRRMAFGESALWTLTLYPRKASVELAAEWFRQCSSSNLGLTLSRSFYGTRLLSVAAKIISPYSDRVRSLCLAVDKAMMKSISLLPLENLAKLSLNLTHERDKRWHERDVQFRMPTPSLRSVEIAFPSRGFSNRLLLRLPLAQLTNLELKGPMSDTHLITVLSECVSLEKCTIWGKFIGIIRHNASAPMQDTTILLPHLRFLKIASESDLSSVLFSLDTPKLCSLVTNIALSSHRCHSFFGKHSHLRYVMVDGTARPNFIDENFLASISTSVGVALQTYSLQQSTLIRIAAGELLPNVEDLSISTDDLQSVLNMLCARILKAQESPGNTSFIKKATVSYPGGAGSFKEMLTDLRSNGVDIRLESRSLRFSFS